VSEQKQRFRNDVSQIINVTGNNSMHIIEQSDDSRLLMFKITIDIKYRKENSTNQKLPIIKSMQNNYWTN